MSKDSAHRVLKENNMIFTSTQKEYHTFTEEEKENSVKFYKSMLKRKGQPIDETFYSDEMGINIKGAHKSKVWTRKGNKKIKAEKPEETVKLNCWGAISSKGTTSLHIYKENLNSDLYEEIIFDHKKDMQDIQEEDQINFIHDNSSIHVAVNENLKNNGFNMIYFPTYSPDLNPIENLWGSLKREITNDQ